MKTLTFMGASGGRAHRRRGDLLGLAVVLLLVMAVAAVLTGRSSAAPIEPVADNWYEGGGPTIPPLATDDLVAAYHPTAGARTLRVRNTDGTLGPLIVGSSASGYIASDGVGIWDRDFKRWVRDGSSVRVDVDIDVTPLYPMAAAGHNGQVAALFDADTGPRERRPWLLFEATEGDSPDWSLSSVSLGFYTGRAPNIAFDDAEGIAIISWSPIGLPNWQDELVTLRRDASGEWSVADRQNVPRVRQMHFEGGQLYMFNGQDSPHLRWYRYLGGVYPCDCSGPAPFYELVDEVAEQDLGELGAGAGRDGRPNDGVELLDVENGRLVLKIYNDFGDSEIQLVNAVGREFQQSDPFVVWAGCQSCGAGSEGAALIGNDVLVNTVTAPGQSGTLQRFDIGAPPGIPDPRPNAPAPVEPPAPANPDACTIFGTAGDDVLEGTAGDDVICGFGGNDVIRAGAGDDRVLGGPGNDLIRGGDGVDQIFGGDGNDDVEAGGGNDKVFGGNGNDKLRGGGGNDIIHGEDGDDLVSGWRGNDVLRGGSGVDHIFGGEGDDLVEAGVGNDKVYGGLGNDTLRGDGGDDTVRGEAGNDKVYGGWGNDTLFGGRGADNIEGGEGADIVLGEQDNDWLDGGEGADEMWGGPGDDRVNGGKGDDIVGGGPGQDVVHGQAGNDRLYSGSGSSYLNGGQGVDICRGATISVYSCEQ